MQKKKKTASQVSLLYIYAAWTQTSMHILSYVTTDLKLVSEDGNLQVCM